jgi:glycosyltransferase involved in cell wall biosynthesis
MNTRASKLTHCNDAENFVSCIIIFLNGEKYLDEAIRSVIAQSYENWELILVDDGSTDGATEIARAHAAQHPGRIIYTEHPGHANRGMSASRNAGIGLARGRYIAFLDADDVWLPNRLARHVDALDRHPAAAMSMSPTIRWSSWNKDNLPASRPWLSADIVHGLGIPAGQVLKPPSVAVHYLNSHGAGVPGICSLLIRKDALLAVGAFEETFRRLYEDQVMLFKMFLRYPVIAIGEALDYYRQHPESACEQDGGVNGDRLARPIFLEWLQTYLVQQGITNPDVWRALRGEMWRFDNPRAWKVANLPHAIVDRWGTETRRAVVWLLTPRLYHGLRKRLGMKPVSIEQM